MSMHQGGKSPQRIGQPTLQHYLADAWGWVARISEIF
jgi:hypothetical protein